MPRKETVRRARMLRQRETDIEYRLWQALRSRRVFGLKFRRQHPVGPYVADFACVEAKLLIEIDGYWHAKRADADERRTAFLRALGFEVIRFNIEAETTDVAAIAETIAYEAKQRLGR